MNRSRWVALVALSLASAARGAELPKPLAAGLKHPDSVCVGADGRVYVATLGQGGGAGDGAIDVVDGGKAGPLAGGLDRPTGMFAFKDNLFAVASSKVVRVGRNGKTTVVADAGAFPFPPGPLSDLTVDEMGTAYMSAAHLPMDKGWTIFRVDPRGKVTVVTDAKRNPEIRSPSTLLNDGMSHLLVGDGETGELRRVRIADGNSEKVADGFKSPRGLAFDGYGRLFVSDPTTLWAVPRPGAKPVRVAEGFQAAGDIAYDLKTNCVLVPDAAAGTITAIPAQVPGAEVDFSPLPFQPEVAFPDLEWTGWEKEVNGKIAPLRPLVLTHAGDGSNRVFVSTQQGVIHVFPNDQKATKTKVFLDIHQKVRYADNENEEGLLGFCFHPRFKENGEFYLFYNPKRLTSVISRFKVSKDDPDRADPASEEVIFKVERPYWNHAGGTIAFGPDGCLYAVLGDGGLGNDPHGNGQNLGTYLGKALRFDVDHRDEGKGYAVPKDNPFVGTKDAKPEIYCYGLRNPWRIAFDRKTGKLWCADVGQNLYEEIDHLVSGGNYGWSRREGLHPFGPKGTGPRPEFIDPIWEYSHDVGKSITGGTVYRGSRLPELEGHYLYADYVTNKLWALKYDETAKRVVANHSIPDKGVPVMSFGEDETGDVYFMTYSGSGRAIYRFARSAR